MSYKHYILIAISLVAIFFTLSLDPIPQKISYHCFADQNTILFPNFWNVISNLPFLFVGFIALKTFLKKHESTSQYIINLTLATGIILTCFGSAYYHYTPNNHTLLWDRLPMTLIFMSFFSSILAKYISPKFYKYGLKFFLPIGLLSVIYWYLSELLNVGDLRLYALVQFLPIILIPITMVLFKSKNLTTKNILLIFFFYVLAKFFEYFDHELFHAFKLISGHSLKHIAAAIACYFMVKNEQTYFKVK